MSAPTRGPLRLLLADDSPSSRGALEAMLSAAPGLAVAGVARDGEEALMKALQLAPDLVVLDLQMPRLDGFTFLRLLMAQRPTPVLVLSSLSRRSDVFKALELGALDFVAKPEGPLGLEPIREELVEKCRTLAALRVERAGGAPGPCRAGAAGLAAAEPDRLLAIGASTGGPQALQRLLSALPGDLPMAVLVAQHMPEKFTAAFAERLAATCPFGVQEAADGDLVAAGRVLVAPGGRDLDLRRDAAGLLRAVVAEPGAGPRRPCPSVDRLLAASARLLGARVCALVLTGMGSDGRQGAAAVRRAGGLVLAEAAETAVVYGMPQAAAAAGVVDELLPLPLLAPRVARFARGLA